jgi:peptide/nickel transport system substrate-binding protein
MKTNRFLRTVGIVATSALTVAGLSTIAMAPAGAATRSTVILHSAGEITSLNSSTNDGNTVYNGTVGSLTGAGFIYYDNGPKLVRNTTFGTMAVSKNTPTDFRITYKVKPGRVWSDGTPITGVDLLLSHVISSNEYSKSAGLGDPSDGDVTPVFDSVGYGGPYGNNVVGLPVLSSDKMSVTIRFKNPLPDWELLAPGPSPVHALQLIADGKKGLQSASVNNAAKAKFLSTFTSKNSANLKKLGTTWTTAYNIKTINSSTNPLLLISNGGFIVKSAVADSTMTLVRNARYNSGPAMKKVNPIKTVLIKTISNDTAAVAALRNGDIDIYQNSNPTTAAKALLDQIRSVTVESKVSGTYSHFGLRMATANGETKPYTGVFAGTDQKAIDMRTAFLLALPREQILSTFIKPLKADAKTMDTQFGFTGSPTHTFVTKSSGVSLYTTGTQDDRTAKALALVKKHYPAASATNSVAEVKLWYANTAGVRVSTAQLIKAEAKKAGFDVDTTGVSDFPNKMSSSDFDATLFAYGLTSISQSNATEVYKTDGGNNVWGWGTPALDTILKGLQSKYLTAAQVDAERLKADKIIYANAYGLPLYQNVSISAWSKALKGIKPAPLSPNLVWNYWEWSF